MSARGRLVVYITFNVDIKKVGDLQGISADLQQMKQRYESVKDVKTEFVQATEQESVSMRRLALDLRMMSIGLYILRREFGGAPGPIDTTTKSLFIFSAGVSAAMGTFGLFRDIGRYFAGVSSLSGIFDKLKGAIMGAGIAGQAFLIVGAAFAGLALGTWIGEQISGISTLREQIKGWTKDLEELKIAMLDISVEQARLSEETAYYSAWLEKVKYAEELAGGATKETTRLREYLEAALKRNKVEAAGLAWETARDRREEEEFGRAIKQTEHEISRVEERVWGGWGGLRFGGRPTGAAGMAQPQGQRQLGGEISQPGLYYLHRGEVIEQRERAITNLAAGAMGGAGPISVRISIPGAMFGTGTDIEAALRRGGREAGQEIRRELEYMRYGVRPR